jgi:hypothetical protein
MQLDRHSDGTYAVLSLQAACPVLTEPLQMKYSLLYDVDPSHRGLVQWSAPGSTVAQALVFATESAQQALALQPQGPWETLRQYVVEGVWHIWIGFDHILFLLALLLPAVLVRTATGGWRAAPSLRPVLTDVLRVVTAFTVAHSITLALAAFDVLNPPSRWVESVIAASVVLAALNNLYPVIREGRWKLTFVFGLVHGFGFASALKDIGLTQGGLALPLFGFNLGVELGQLAIVAIFVAVVWTLRDTRLYRGAGPVGDGWVDVLEHLHIERAARAHQPARQADGAELDAERIDADGACRVLVVAHRLQPGAEA